MTLWEAALLVLGGTAAGIINAMAGGGSILTVPLLVLAGVSGNDANGSNRVGILVSNMTAAWSFHQQGVKAYREAVPILLPVVIGSLIGSIAISRVTDDAFETIFGLLMLPIIFLSIRKPKVREDAETWSRATTVVVFVLIGIYGGAIQAGVGLVLLAALTRAGFDLVTANVIKVLITLVVTAIALPVFIINDQVRWIPALILTAGLGFGGWVGARIAVKGGERVIRIVMVVAAVGLAGRLLGLY
ncbi:MAG: sulfite exporter TauE/SafE family protein [Acidimicrobiales bacterium]